MPGKMNQDIIEAAIVGYQSKISDLQQRIAELRSMLDGTLNGKRETAPSAVAAANEKRGGGRRRMSAAAKRKLSLAAKKRWALLKRQHPNAKTLAG
jgi:cell division septum initiation protein DivIVA